MPSETEKYSYLCGSNAKKRTQNEKNPPIYFFTHHCHPGNDCTHRHRHGTDSPLHCHTAQTRSASSMAHHHRRHRLASLLRPVGPLYRKAEGRIAPHSRPATVCRHQHHTATDTCTRHSDISFGIRTVGRMSVGTPRQGSWLRRFAVCHQRMPPPWHGAACLDCHHACRQMGRNGMQTAAQKDATQHNTHQGRRLHESRDPADCRLSGRHLRRSDSRLRRGRHPPRLHPLSRRTAQAEDFGTRQGPRQHYTHRTHYIPSCQEH